MIPEPWPAIILGAVIGAGLIAFVVWYGNRVEPHG